ncbi:dna ligase [Matsumuraeses phaseoli granulovirus]|uniref:DNA ligase n=1 Tax=Matsumuraeses phaseoli granulovirus TaxID=2760664 RepID=A0AAE7MLH6_9BBAC|nr:dna ligase [Matsumuraeses phaseoli granulovirus]QOD40071.1 dna ligase [Matsumuraeses phaseoli granulovirus]
MLFSKFADVYKIFLSLTSVNEINLFINKNCNVDNKNEIYLWLYLISTFDNKFKINDKHLLTVFCKLQKPHIDRKNLQEAFKMYGVAQTCSKVANVSQCESLITMTDVYVFLQHLQTIPSKNFHLLKHFRTIVPHCDAKTLFCLISIIRNTSRNKRLLTKKRNLYLFKQVFGRKSSDEMDVMVEGLKRSHDGSLVLKTVNVGNNVRPGKPIEPMLAQPCKSFEHVSFNEMCIEIKYNGERVQLHKFDQNYTCYKRNLNVNLKCNDLLDVMKRVLRDVHSVILDCEMVGNCTSTTQLIVFDVLYYNGQCLINEKLCNRKTILQHLMSRQEERMKCINYVISDDKNAVEMWIKDLLKLDALCENNAADDDTLEGVVVKWWHGAYEPKRKKWFKIKRSYFQNVCSADLVVVGGWKSERKKGDKTHITIYLVATPFYDEQLQKWMFLPVSKVKFSKNNYENLMEPYDCQRCDWLVVDDHLKSLKKIPDMVAKNPLTMPVWEMEGDFVRNANTWQWGSTSRTFVSIRLPRFIRVRHDKTYLQANTIFDLQLLSSITSKTFDYPELYDIYLKDNIKNYSPMLMPCAQ